MDDLIARLSEAWAALPSPIIAVIILIAGWIAAKVLRFLVSGFLSLIRFDRIGERTGFSEFLKKGNAKYTPSRLVGVLTYWIVLMAVFLEIVRVLDPGIYQAFSGQLAQALPNLAAAILIIVVGTLLASFLSNFILTIALNASMPNARLLAKAIKYLGVAIVLTVALEQVGLGKSIVEFIFQVLFGAVAFGAALAFGLGCKDLARESAKRFIDALRERGRGGQGSDLEG
jgi:hypothetical protein